MSKNTKISFVVVILVALGIAFNNLGWVGWLPIMSNLIYSVSVFDKPSCNEALLYELIGSER